MRVRGSMMRVSTRVRRVRRVMPMRMIMGEWTRIFGWIPSW